MRGVFKKYDEPASPNRGAESPNEGRVEIYMITRNRPMGGVSKIYDEPHWSGVFKVYDSRNRQMRGVF